MAVKFRCRSCNYEFYPRVEGTDKPPKRCPYCSTEGSVGLKKHILEEI